MVSVAIPLNVGHILFAVVAGTNSRSRPAAPPYTSNQAHLTALAGCTTTNATGPILAWTGRSPMQLFRSVPGNYS